MILSDLVVWFMRLFPILSSIGMNVSRFKLDVLHFLQGFTSGEPFLGVVYYHHLKFLNWYTRY